MDWVRFKQRRLAVDLPAAAVNVPFGGSFYFEILHPSGHGRPSFTAMIRVDLDAALAERWAAELGQPQPGASGASPAKSETSGGETSGGGGGGATENSGGGGGASGGTVWVHRGRSLLCPGGWQADSSTRHPDHVTHSRNVLFPIGKPVRWVQVFCFGHEGTWDAFEAMTRRIVLSLKLG
jgi:hypothetical protein